MKGAWLKVPAHLWMGPDIFFHPGLSGHLTVFVLRSIFTLFVFFFPASFSLN